MNATIQPLSSQSAPPAALSTRPIAHQGRTPHTRSALSSTINIQERVAAAEKAIKNKFPGVGVYRIGGDEFVVFIEKRTVAIVEKLIEEFRDSMTEKARSANRTPDEAVVSCGYALYHPETDASCEDVFHRADRNMYEDKERFYKANPHLKRRV